VIKQIFQRNGKREAVPRKGLYRLDAVELGNFVETRSRVYFSKDEDGISGSLDDC